MLSAFMGFIEQGDEVIIFEPFFDQYISNIEMPGGTIRYVPLSPPKDGATTTSSAANWTIDMDALEKAFNANTRMIVLHPASPGISSSTDYLSGPQLSPQPSRQSLFERRTASHW